MSTLTFSDEPRWLIATGPVNSGKSSRLWKITTELSEQNPDNGNVFSGFICLPEFKGKIKHYRVCELQTGREYRLTAESGNSLIKLGKFSLLQSSLERMNDVLLSCGGTDRIVVDESGWLELSGEGLWPGIESLLKAGTRTRVLLVVRDFLVSPLKEKLLQFSPQLSLNISDSSEEWHKWLKGDVI